MWPAIIAAAGSMLSSQGGGGGGGGGGAATGGGSIGNLYGHSPDSRLAGTANGLFNLFFAKNPSDAANPYLEQMEGKAGQYMNHYIDEGKRAGGIWGKQNELNVSDPTAVMDKVGANYKKSPGYQFNMDEAMRAANNSAAAGGMAGTPAEQQRAQTVASGLASQDYGAYVDRGLGQYGLGMGGLSHQNDIGFMGSQTMAQAAIAQLMAQAQNAYEGANTSNQQKGGGIGSILGG